MQKMLQTENLVLKAPCKEDYDLYRRIRPCEEFYLMVGSDQSESVFENDKKFDKSFSASLERENYWFVFLKSEIIGVAFLHSIDLIDKHARYAVGIYEEKNWVQGYGGEITKIVLKYAFQSLNLHKVDLRVLEYNKRGIASYKRSGFIQEGVLRENAFINNAWHSDILMSVLCHEFNEA